MINTSAKSETLRTARAGATLLCSAETTAALRENRVPKGNALEMARAAGILAGKRTHELIPLCHPLPLDQVDVSFDIGDREVRITAIAVVTARTGVEMEALTAASVAALTLYDMLKPLDDHLEISAIRLLEKRGGKSDFPRLAQDLEMAVVVMSDRAAKGEYEDKTGPSLQKFVKDHGARLAYFALVPDEPSHIRSAVEAGLKAGARLVVTAGGTGLGPRDVTVEAVRPMLEREVPGLAEAVRAYGARRHPYAALSRGIAGTVGDALIITLPGSPRGATESLESIFPAAIHALAVMRGARHE